MPVAIEVLEDTSRVVRWAPEKWWANPADTGLAAPTCTMLRPDGSTLASLTITHATLLGTVGTVTSQTVHRLTATALGRPVIGTRIAYYRGNRWYASGKVAAVADVVVVAPEAEQSMASHAISSGLSSSGSSGWRKRRKASRMISAMSSPRPRARASSTR